MPTVRAVDRAGNGIFAERVTRTVEKAMRKDKLLEERLPRFHGVRLSARMAGETAKVISRLPEQKQELADQLSETFLEHFSRVLEKMLLREIKTPAFAAYVEPKDIKGQGLGEIVSVEEGARRLEEITVPMSLEEWAGPVAGSSEIKKNLGIARSTLDHWRRSRKVIALLSGVKNHVYPVAQFVDGRPAEGLEEINKIIGNSRTAWLWLSQNNPVLSGKKPIELLKRGRADEVLDVARAYFAPL